VQLSGLAAYFSVFMQQMWRQAAAPFKLLSPFLGSSLCSRLAALCWCINSAHLAQVTRIFATTSAAAGVLVLELLPVNLR
jgi:hypothetical protein